MSYSLLYGLYPPRVAGEPFEEGRSLPVRAQRLRQRILYQDHALERPVGQASPELLKPSLRRVQLRRAWWEPEEGYVLRINYSLGAMARRAVQDHEKVLIGVALCDLLQEYLQASVVHP